MFIEYMTFCLFGISLMRLVAVQAAGLWRLGGEERSAGGVNIGGQGGERVRESVCLHQQRLCWSKFRFNKHKAEKSLQMC